MIQQECGSSAFLPLLSSLNFQQRFDGFDIAGGWRQRVILFCFLLLTTPRRSTSPPRRPPSSTFAISRQGIHVLCLSSPVRCSALGATSSSSSVRFELSAGRLDDELNTLRRLVSTSGSRGGRTGADCVSTGAHQFPLLAELQSSGQKLIPGAVLPRGSPYLGWAPRRSTT